MPEPPHRGAKWEVTFSVLAEWAPGVEGKSGVRPGAPQESSRRQTCLPGWSLPGDRCALLRTLLQQLQKLQTLVTNKISRPYKMAATQTGTCLMVGAVPSPQGHGRTSLPQAGFLRDGESSEGLAILPATSLGSSSHGPQPLSPSPWNLLEHDLP